MAVNYNSELKKMAAHRKQYVPVMKKMLELHGEMKGSRGSRNLIDEPWVTLLLELIDLEYVDMEMFVIEKSFGSVTAVYYNGGAPLTDSGKIVFREIEQNAGKGRIKLILTAILIAAVLVFFVYLLW